MDFFKQIQSHFKQGDILTRLIGINIGVWVLITIVNIILRLFNIHFAQYLEYIAVPSDLTLVIRRIWTLVTYMFLHKGFLHLLFNMLCLYWFGKMFLFAYNQKQLLGLYINGGLLGALVYLISYNVFPYFTHNPQVTYLMGASASIMAIIVAVAMQMPDMELRFFLMGNLKLKYFALIVVAISFLGITSANSGGELAHLGGALAGYLFIVFLRRGIDSTRWFTAIADWFVNCFVPRKRVKQTKFHYAKQMSDAEYNQTKAQQNREVDAILDKIKRSGYESLTDDEKKKLFQR